MAITEERKNYIKAYIERCKAGGRCRRCTAPADGYMHCEACRRKRNDTQQKYRVKKKKQARREHGGHKKHWLPHEDALLQSMIASRRSMPEIADHFGRSIAATKHRASTLRNKSN